MAGLLPALSALFGWAYTLCWSASFYPQPLLNWHRRSTSGTTVDFPFLNVVGFAAYLASTLAFYCSPLVRQQYAARNHGLAPTVQLNDIVFALHALVLSVLTASQYLARPLWGFAPAPAARPSRLMLGVAAGCLAGVAATYLVVVLASSAAAAPLSPLTAADAASDAASGWCELDIVYAVSYVKLLVTLIKYTPQIVANWRNQSTRGWSIWQVLLDLAGGILSIAQQGIDSWLQRDWSGITGNPVKFALGNASLVYDSVFMAQHYVLYRGADAAPAPAAVEGKSRWTSEEEPLLVDGDDECRRRRRLD